MSVKGVKYPAEILNPEEVEALMGACSPKCPTGLRNRALLATLRSAGLRISEALDLEPRDIQPCEGGANVRVRDGKGHKARTTAMNDKALLILQVWLERKKGMGIAGPIFSTLKGEPLWDSYVRDLLKRLAKKAGIEKRVHAHGFRHTFAAGLAETTTDIRVVQRALGHSNLATTATYVDHLCPTRALDAIKAAGW